MAYVRIVGSDCDVCGNGGVRFEVIEGGHAYCCFGEDYYDFSGGDSERPDGWANLDATKGIGYVIREDGKYGSHPSHDRFDDDSEP